MRALLHIRIIISLFFVCPLFAAHFCGNAVAQAARNGVRIDGGEIYVTASPCFNCFKLLVNAGVRRICYGEFYRDARIGDFARELGVELVDLTR